MRDSAADAACKQDGRVPLTPGGMALTTAATGQSGSGGGNSDVLVTVTPGSVTSSSGPPPATQFTATVSGTTDQDVVWSCSGMGSIDQTGLWTPPGGSPPPAHGGASITATAAVNGTSTGGAGISW